MGWLLWTWLFWATTANWSGSCCPTGLQKVNNNGRQITVHVVESIKQDIVLICRCVLETSMKNLETHLLNLLGEAERRVLELRLCGNQDNLQTKSLALWERRKRGLKKMLIGFEHASK